MNELETKMTEFVRKIISYYDPQVQIDTKKTGDVLVLSVKSDEASILIGKKGQNIAAWQVLVEVFFYRNFKDQKEIPYVVIDIQDFRKERLEQGIEEFEKAKSQLEDATSGTSVQLDILDSFIRKVVHSTVAVKYDDLETDMVVKDGRRTMMLTKI